MKLINKVNYIQDTAFTAFRCKVNCMEKVNAEFSFNLETECLNCNETERHHLTYDWRLYQTDHLGRQHQRIGDTFEEFTGTGKSSGYL